MQVTKNPLFQYQAAHFCRYRTAASLSPSVTRLHMASLYNIAETAALDGDSGTHGTLYYTGVPISPTDFMRSLLWPVVYNTFEITWGLSA